MNVSGSRVAPDIDLEDFEKRLRAAGTPAGGVEDPLAELARLVEASRPKAPLGQAAPPAAAAAPPAAVPAPAATSPQPPSPIAPPIEAAALRPAYDDPIGSEPEADAVFDDNEPTAAPELFGDVRDEPAPPRPRRSRRWLWTVSTLAIAGVAMIGAVFALKGRLPGMPKAAPFIAAAQGPTKVQPPSEATVSTPNDVGASLLKDNTQVGRVTVVNTEEQPVDLHAQTAPPPSPAPAAPSASSGSSPVRGAVDAPVVVMTPPPAPAMAPSFPEPKPVRTISLRPDGTPIPTSVAEAEAAPPASEPAKAPSPPAKPAPKATAAAEPSTPKIDLPTKLSAKSSARVVVGKTDTTAPADAPVQLGATSKPEKPAKIKTQQAAAEPKAPAAAEPAETTSGGWAVQLAAPRSEAEAKGVVAKLNETYASALGGAALGVHKATAKGDTVYRVRVSGLSKADAASLCARVKGDGGQCFVTK